MHQGTRSVLRHRGKSPRQAGFFFKNPENNFQSAQLASLYLMYGLLDGTGPVVKSTFRIGSLDCGVLVCRAYEVYLELHAPAIISFEHAWFLMLALGRCDEVSIGRCEICGGVRLRDLLARRKSTCANCDTPPPLPS